MIIPRYINFQSVKFLPQILVPGGIIQKSKKVCKISEITFHSKEQEITRENAQAIELPDDSFPRYDFSKCEILTSNFGP